MLNLDRIKLLKAYCEEEPENPFNFYALALEYRTIDLSEATHFFDHVLLNFPNYLPVYFPAAQFFHEDGQLLKAKELFTTGITLAEVKGDEKAKKELRAAYQNFLFETDLE